MKREREKGSVEKTKGTCSVYGEGSTLLVGGVEEGEVAVGHGVH